MISRTDLLILALCVLAVACSKPAVNNPIVIPETGADAGVTARSSVIVTDSVIDGDTDFYRAGATAYGFEQWSNLADARQRYLGDANPGLLLVEVEWPRQTGFDPPADAEWEPHFDELFGEAFTAVLDAGGSVMLHIAGPPRWASSDPMNDSLAVSALAYLRSAPEAGDGTYPQWTLAVRNLAEWANARFPEASSSGRVVIAYGVELDNHEYQSALATYAPAFDAAARAVRGVNPGIRVGGGGRFDALSVKTSPAEHSTTRPVLDEFLEDCAAIDCPLDVLFGHNFSLLPTPWASDDGPGQDAHADAIDSVRAVAETHGFTDLEYILTDHTTWESGEDWLSLEHDTEYRAAHLAASLVAMRRAGFASHTIGTLFEQVTQTEFTGDWGLFTRRGVAKPSFHAAAMTSRLAGGRLLQVRRTDELDRFVAIEAVEDDAELRVLVTRFVPETETAKLIILAFAGRYYAEGHGLEELQAVVGGGSLQEAEQSLFRIIQAADSDALVDPSPEVGSLFNGIFDVVREAETAGLAEVSVDVSSWGLTEPPVVYRMNATHSNSYDYCVRERGDCSDAATVNASGASLDQLDDVHWNRSSGFVTLTLERHQVDLLVFEKP